MQERITPNTLYEQCPRLATHLIGLSSIPESAGISASLRHLITLRASQINGCGFCQHMHSDEARSNGEEQQRLDVLPAWRELGCFSQEERAALAWTEALTLVANQAVEDHVFQQALDVFGEQRLIELTTIILEINSWNRIAVGFRFQPEIK